MGQDPDDPRIHDGTWTAERPAHLRTIATVHSVLQGFAARLTSLNDRNVRLAGHVLRDEDPRVIAAQLSQQAEMLRVSVILRSTDGTNPWDLADSVGAQLVALKLALDRADEFRIDSGDAA